MRNDKQVIHHLYWIKSFLDRDFGNKDYKEIIQEDLNNDAIKELDELVSYIKLNY